MNIIGYDEIGIFLPDEGGFNAGKIKYPNGTVWTLILAPKDAELYTQWKVDDSPSDGAASVFDGFLNSSNLTINSSVHTAAYYCRNYTGGGKQDWYLPSKAELEIVYYHFKPTSDFNNQNSGENKYAYPDPTSTYSFIVPSKTKVVSFQEKGSQALNTENSYWTSTMSSAVSAWAQGMGVGYQSCTSYKTTMYIARPMRKIKWTGVGGQS